MTAESQAGTRQVILDELRRTLSHLLQLVEELDDKVETVMRLGVFTVTGMAVFLTYATRADAAINLTGLRGSLMVSGALIQVVSFYALLRSYGVLAAARRLDIGADLASRRNLEERPDEVFDVIFSAHRKAIRRMTQTYGDISDSLSFGTLLLFLGALLYLIAIYLSVQV